MPEKRIQFSNIVQNQLPAYTRTEFPLVSEFLKQYYLGQEYQGGPLDLIQNIDQYTKVSEQTNLVDSVGLSTSVDAFTDVIPVDMSIYPAGTDGFPDSYGLIKIDNEIITYTGTAATCFTGCVRGFCGISSYRAENKPDVLVFDSTSSEEHTGGSKIQNLSTLFLKEFLLKTKHQLLPGLEDRPLHEDLDQNIFIKQAKDFYLSKGTDRSFEILFKSLYNEDVRIIKPRDFLFTPSNANFKVTRDFVVENIVGEGNPIHLENSTLKQDEYKAEFSKAYAPISRVEPINTGAGTTYYKLSIDAGYNRDARVDGSIYGEFNVHPKTRVIGQVSAGTTSLDVDSTVGFPTSGELYCTYSDGEAGIVSYTSRNLTQFFGCTNINGTISNATNVGVNTYVYGVSSEDATKNVKVRIGAVLDKFDYPDNTQGYGKDDIAKIKTLGIEDKTFKGKDWFYNVASSYKILSVSLIDSSDFTYRVELSVDHYLKVGDQISVLQGSDELQTSTVLNINSAKSFNIKGQGIISDSSGLTFRRIILKGVSNTFPNVTPYSTNVQNVYRRNDDNYLVASSSIPSYYAQPLNVNSQAVVFSGTFNGTDFLIKQTGDHGFYTGDAVWYSPERVEVSSFDSFGNKVTNIVDGTELFDEGLYFVKRVDASTIKLATSRTNISNGSYKSIDTTTTVVNNRLEPYDFRFKTLQSQDILREFVPSVKNNEEPVKTVPGFTGLLVNGVEIVNYKASDNILYGQLDHVDASSPGRDYDVINPPILHISDNAGIGATGYVAVSGSLQDLRIIDPGFDYEETPTVTVNGGNGSGADVSVVMKQINHKVDFFADAASQKIGIGTTVNNAFQIGFSTYHQFRNAERVLYYTYSQTQVGGLTTNAQYYVNTNPGVTTVTLHKTEGDAIAGINTITLTSNGIGKQALASVNKKLVVSAFNVINSGSGYENKQTTTAPSGINTATDTVTINNHGYNSGEIIKYTSEVTAPGGLTSGTEYYLTKVNNNSFKLSSVGVNTNDKKINYRTKQYIDFTSIGVGTHNFNYQPITVTLKGKVGISSISGNTFQCEVQPIVRGEIKSVHLSDNGVGYGSSEIINFERQPEFNLIAGSQAQLEPVINNGQIQEVLVNNVGKEYNSPPDLVLIGDGVGGVITPVLENNTITSVKVIEKGAGYTQANTSINVVVPGSGAEFDATIENWRINLFQRHYDNFTGDDGFIADEFNQNKGLQYSHIYAPRKLREALYGTVGAGSTVSKTLYGKRDLTRVNSLEVASTDHSPIIGWAYDGNPIYGPYGYSKNNGGVVRQMKTGYVLSLKTGRPPLSEFPAGFFVDDYIHNTVIDETVLDENNGRFCVTPEFPNGTYAYFATVNDGVADGSGPFAGYKRPTFPYLIGNSYNSTPNQFNFNSYSNQEQYPLNKTEWIRNTVAYNLIEGNLEYEYAYIPNKLKQEVEIKAVVPGIINKIGIQTSGTQYRVGDKVLFNNAETEGEKASAVVSKVIGKDVTNISVATSSITSVEVYPGQKGQYILYSNKPHGWADGDIIGISGLSTTSAAISGNWKAGISTATFSLAGVGTNPTGIGSDGVTGIITYFPVEGDFSKIDPNDILKIGDEKIKVLAVEPANNRIRVLRAQEGTSGAAHTVTTVLYEDSRKVTIEAGFSTTYTVKLNTELYFKPTVTTSVGSSVISPAGVGVGTTATVTAAISSSGATQGQVTSYTITDGGSSYDSAPAVTVGNPAGSTPSATVGLGTTGVTAQGETTVSSAGPSQGKLATINTSPLGAGYTAAPTVTFAAPTGVTGLATVGLHTVGTGNTTSINPSTVSIANSGLGYATAPTITISEPTIAGGGTTVAVGIATVDPNTGVVTAIAFDWGPAYPWVSGAGIATIGVGYSEAPTLTFSSPSFAGGLTTATATAVYNPVGSAVSTVNITNTGFGYSSAPTVTFSAPTIGAAASLSVSPGSVSIASSGLGYATAPTITVSEPTLVSGSSTVAVGIATVNAAGLVTAIGFSTTVDAWAVGTAATIGYGYLSAPTLSFSAPSYALGLTTATATATVSAQSVSAITATAAGFGYTSAPTVTIGDPDSAPIYETGVGLGATVQLADNPNYPNKRTCGIPVGGFPRGQSAAGVGLTDIKVPYKTIWMPNHGFVTGDQVDYYPNLGAGLLVQDQVVSEPTSGTFVGNTTSILQEGQRLFIAKVSNDLIGIATVRVGLDTVGNNWVGIAESVRQSSTLAIIGVGTGVEHSFKTVYNPITCEISRNLVTVSTGSTHGLLDDDEVDININPSSISTTFNVQYNDYNRRIVINPKDFTAVGVNTTTNEITINNHGFIDGQKIIHTATTSSVGLANNTIYYVVRVDDNTLKLAENKYKATLLKPEIIGITSASAGTLNPVNPLIKVYKNQPVIFDLSSSTLGYVNQATTYSAFEFNLYTDQNLTKKWDTDGITETFNVVRTGKAGVDADAKVELRVNNDIPSLLYYTLDILEESNVPAVKKSIIRRDSEVKDANEIETLSSGYDGVHKVAVGATNSFTYTLGVKPEKSSYISTTSVLSYETESKTAFGGVAGFELKDGGQNYYAVPGITTIVSETGKGALIDVKADSIGRIKRVHLKDIGYNFPSDTTLRPSVGLPQIITIENLASIKSIGISSVGRGYTTAPKLIVFDGITNKQDKNIDLDYNLGDQQVSILKNTRGLSNVQPTIIPTNATNGVGINTVGFNTVTKDVSVTLAVGFSTAGSFPFVVGDKVLVEGVSVGLATTARGYNSAEYDYKLFEITAVDPNIGGLGIVTYSVYDYYSDLDPNVTPGEFNQANSVGRLIPEKYFPIFDVKLGVHDYLKGEIVSSNSAIGEVENWDAKLGELRVSASEDFKIDEVITGRTSETQGVASSITTYESDIITNVSSERTDGWETDSGVLNYNMQRIQDSFYYQNFSYSLRSKVQYETWDDVVSSLNHAIGHIKFSDMQVDSLNDNSMTVGLTTESTSYEVVSDLYGIGNVNCFHDFDLVRENSKNVQGKVVSDEIIFDSRVLMDYDESIGNRVLSIDDVSGSFNHRPRATQYSIANEFDLSTTRSRKTFHYIQDKRFTGQRQLLVSTVIHDYMFGYLNVYGNGGNVYDIGSFDFAIAGGKGQLRFYPRNYKVNDYHLTSVSYNLEDEYLGIGTTSVGVALIESHSTEAAKSDASTVIVGIASTYRSAKVLVSINPDQSKTSSGEYEYDELNIIHDGSTIDLAEYGQLITVPSDANATGFGTYSCAYSGSDIQLLWHPDSNNAGVGTTAVLNTITIGIGNSDYSGIGTFTMKHSKFDTRSTTIASASVGTTSVIGEYITQVSSTVEGYDAGYFIVQLTDTTNGSYNMAEMLIMDDYNLDDGGNTMDLEYGNNGVSGIATLGSRIVADTNAGVATVQLLCTPTANLGIQAQVFMQALKIEDDSKQNIEFNNGAVTSEYSDYEGTERDIKKAFDIRHATTPIFDRSFTGDSSSIVSVDNDTITIPNHFFVTGEKVTYTHVGTGSSGAVGIAATDGFAGVGNTTLLPSEVFVVKINEDKIKLAATAEKSLRQIAETVDITTVGVGTSHRFTSQDQNARVIVSLDNVMQSPVVASAVTTTLERQAYTTDDLVYFTGITSFTGADLFKVGSEIMRIDSIGVGTTNAIRVRRQWLGTTLAGHSTGALVTKVNGNYNIVENVLNFTEAPYGYTPLSSTTNPPDDRDWTGIATSSSFNGRVFMRSGETDSSNKTYYNNYIFDDLSADFNGTTASFDLKTSGSDVTGIATENAVILLNDVFQGPVSNYDLSENAGVTSITFTGAGTSIASDVNTSQLPVGGVIVSVGSTEGMGYQPIVAAGGTVVVSSAGTVSAITIGYSGSGYRSGIGQTVRVAIQTSSLTGAEVVRYGTATIGNNGTITGIAITNTNVIYKPRDIQNVGYNSLTGITTITTATAHGLSNGDSIKLSGIAFTCDYADAVSISTVGYTTSTGIMTVTTYSAHGLSTSGSRSNVIFSGLAFTCALDGGVYQHIYPRNKDRVFNTAVSVASTTSTTITVDVTAAKTLDQYAHTFVGPGTEAVIAGGAYGHKFIGIAQSAVVSGGDYLHTFVSSGVGSVSVTGIGTTTATDATYDAGTGDLVLTIVGHGATTGNTIGIDTGGIVFTCSMDNDGSNHAYPRSTDPLAGYGVTDITSTTDDTITINVGTSATVAHAVENAIYDAPTGILTMTIPSHGLSSERSIRFTPYSLAFTCDMDQHGSIHTYPRTTDPAYNTAVSISATTTDTITVNVGASTQTNYNVTAANYGAATGILTMTVGAGHSIVAGDSIKFKKESLTFTCTKDSNATRHKYPREGDPTYNGTVVTAVNSTTQFEVNIGISTVLSHYTGVGSAKCQPCIVAPRAVNNSTSKTDPAEPGSNILSIVDNYSFIVDTGVSTLPHNYARGGTVEKPLKVVIDEPLSYTNIPLDYATPAAGVGTNATIDIVVSMGGSVRDFRINNGGNGYGNTETLRVPFGGNTGIPTTSSFTNNPFELTVDEIYSDEFTGWSLGTLEALDDWDSKFDGNTVVFQLQRAGDTISIRSSKGSKINVQDVILIFINDILQVPGKGYKFKGGSNVTFTEAPKVGDTSKILFYKGSAGIDVKSKEIIETVKKGDNLTIENGSQPYYLKEDVRGVSTVTSTDTVQTVPYFGPGNTENEDLLRPVVWCKQTEDRVINEELVGKDRELYNANLNPTAYSIKTVGIGSTVIYVSNVRPFFDPNNENESATLRGTIQDKIDLITQQTLTGAAGTALVSTGGTVTGVTISDGGVGYSTATVSFASTTGVSTSTQAMGSLTIGAAGTITGVAITNPGVGYTQTSVPLVIFSPPTLTSETDTVRSYEGDSGVIVGFGTTTISSGTQLIFDLFIPLDSYLRDSTLTGTAVTICGIKTGDFFMVNDSNVGVGSTRITSVDTGDNTIGIGYSYADNVYEIADCEGQYINVTGVGFTYIKRVFAKIDGEMSGAPASGITSSNYQGSYSWGKIIVSRSEENSYTAYTQSGIGTNNSTGISTSTIIRRTNPLKSKSYT